MVPIQLVYVRPPLPVDKNPQRGRKVVNYQDEPDIKDTMRQELDEARHAEFERLYNAYRLAVHGYCARRTSSADAADAVSETFLVAWRRFDEVAPEPDTLPYLYSVAAKVLSNLRRSSRRRSQLGLKLEALGVAPSTDPMTIVVATATRSKWNERFASSIGKTGKS